MNIIDFKTIEIRNFKSVGSEPVKFNYGDLKSMTYVKGENLDIPELANGVGKSAIFVDALLMVLFGKTSNTVNNKDLFNRASTDSVGYIKLMMLINQKEYNIHCILNKSSRSGNVSIDCKLYEGEAIEENDISKGSKLNTLKFIANDLIGSDVDTFKNTVILSTSNIQNFFQLPKSIKEAYLEAVFNLSAFGEVFTDIKKDTNILKKDLTTATNNINSIKESHTQIQEKFDVFAQDQKLALEVLHTSIALKKKEYDALNKTQVDLEEERKELAKIEAKLVKAEANLEKSNVVKANITESISNPLAIKDELDLFKVSSTKLMKAAEKKIKTLITKLKKDLDDKNTLIETLEAKEALAEEKISVLNSKFDIVNTGLAKAKSALETLNTDFKVQEELQKTYEESSAILCGECKIKTAEILNFDEDNMETIKANVIEQIDNIKAFETAQDELRTINDNLMGDSAAARQGTDGPRKNTHEIFNDISIQERELHECIPRMEQAISDHEAKLVADKQVEFVKEINKCDTTISKWLTSIKDLNDAIKKASQIISEGQLIESNIAQHLKDLKDLGVRYKTEELKENPFVELIDSNVSALNEAKETMQDILKDQRSNELLRHIFNEDGVKKHIVANIVASLNILIKKYLAEMGTDYTVIFNDKFKYTFYTVTGECDYFSFSSGERRRLDLAVMMSFRDILFTNGFVTNILIVDEVLDSGIDGYALFAILNILKNKTKDSNLKCVVISHRSEILEEVNEIFDSVYTVQKHNNTTRLITDD